MELVQKRLAPFLLMVLVVNGIVGCMPEPAIPSFPTNVASQPAILPSLAWTPSVTSTPIPRPTQTFTPKPPTQIPTLNPETAQDEILKLLSKPDDSCQFPCWWGQIPGQTRSLDLQNYLNSFNSIGQPTQGEVRNLPQTNIQILRSQDSYINIDISYRSDRGVVTWLQVLIQRLGRNLYPGFDMGDVIYWGDWLVTDTTKPYRLPQVFSTYGQPAEILVFTQQLPDSQMFNAMSLVVFYPTHGFMIKYVMDTAYEGAYPNQTIKGCLYRAFPHFLFWEPSKNFTRRDVLSITSGPDDYYYWVRNSVDEFKTLEEATGIPKEDVMTLFEVDDNKCIETPASIWPTPEK